MRNTLPPIHFRSGLHRAPNALHLGQTAASVARHVAICYAFLIGQNKRSLGLLRCFFARVFPFFNGLPPKTTKDFLPVFNGQLLSKKVASISIRNRQFPPNLFRHLHAGKLRAKPARLNKSLFASKSVRTHFLFKLI